MKTLAFMALCLGVAQSAVAGKLVLDPNKIKLEGSTSNGDPKRMADEQALVGDPISDAKAKPALVTNWSSTSGSHVNVAIIDLGGLHYIDRIYIYDLNGDLKSAGTKYQILSGTQVLVSSDLEAYKAWKGFPNDESNDFYMSGTSKLYRFVDDPSMKFSGVKTQFLKVVHPNGMTGVPEIVVYGRPVDVVPPVISLNGSASVTVEVGGSYSDAGASASDNVDGDISSKIVVSNLVKTSVIGTYKVTYNVKDAEGNAAVPVSRTVVVKDSVKPVLSLVGAASVEVQRNSSYSDAGAKALDNYDGDISSKIVVDNEVLTTVVGTYSVTYNVKDASGNAAAQISRTVNVVEAPPVGGTLADVARGKPAFASSSYSGSNGAGEAVDGDDASMWRSANDAREYSFIEVDLKGYQSITKFELDLGTTSGSAPASFEIQAQNQGCWKTVSGTSVTANPSTTISKSFVLSAPVITNKIRFVCRKSGSGCMLRSFSALGVASSLAAAPAPACAAGQQVMRRAPSYDYAEFLPADYNSNPGKVYPVIVALHGVGGEILQADRSGLFLKDDETKLLGRSPEGLAKQLQSATFRSTFQAIVISPHCREIGVWGEFDPNKDVVGTQSGGGADCLFKDARLEKLWEDVFATYRVNKDQVYGMGLSGGGVVTNRFAVTHHEMFAAIVPIAADLRFVPAAQKAFDSSGNPIPDAGGNHMCDMKQMPIFTIAGTIDSIVKPQTALDYQNIMNVKCKPQYPKMMLRLIPGVGHNGGVWDTVYKDPRTYKWLFAQKLSDRAKPATHGEPSASVNSTSQTVVLPASTASFTGTATSAAGMEQYSWVNIASTGLWPKLQSSATSGAVTFSGYTAAGTYKYRFIATDKNAFSDYKDVTVIVK